MDNFIEARSFGSQARRALGRNALKRFRTYALALQSFRPGETRVTQAAGTLRNGGRDGEGLAK